MTPPGPEGDDLAPQAIRVALYGAGATGFFLFIDLMLVDVARGAAIFSLLPGGAFTVSFGASLVALFSRAMSPTATRSLRVANVAALLSLVLALIALWVSSLGSTFHSPSSWLLTSTALWLVTFCAAVVAAVAALAARKGAVFPLCIGVLMVLASPVCWFFRTLVVMFRDGSGRWV